MVRSTRIEAAAQWRSIALSALLLAVPALVQAKDYWTTFSGPSLTSSTLHSGPVTITNQGAGAGAPYTISTPPFTISDVAFYPASLKTMANHMVRAPVAVATAAAPAYAEIAFPSGPVIDPIVAFYSLDNSGVTLAGTLQSSGGPVVTEIESNQPSMINLAALSVSGPFAGGTNNVEGCFVGSRRVCGIYRLKGLYSAIQLGQFIAFGSSDGVGFQIGLAVTPLPQPDTGSAPFGLTRIAIADLRVNDSMEGAAGTAVPANTGLAVVSMADAWPAGFTLNPATGAVTVSALVAPGQYILRYRLCDAADPTDNCAESTATITVRPPAPVAVPTLPASGLAVLVSILALSAIRIRRRG
ncbi:hypothetical protein [Ottowia thiooxydans]|uniref:hypothetical protein n=1 Tax=Ottowia thiooxydans TaxID=219182 RepID=UPI0004218C84|nr:hypothetical protein [Ottowia thiooxydans]